MSENTGKTAQEAYVALKKGLQEQLLEFKKSIEEKREYTPDETAYLVKESIKDQIVQFQDALVKMRELETGEKLSKKTPENISEDLMHKLKDQYSGDKSAAYGTAWKISKLKNRKGKKHKKAEDSSVSVSNSEGSVSASVSDGEVRVRAGLSKAEPGPMSPGGLLQIHHNKPTVPTAATDKHPAIQPAQPVVMHPPQSPVVEGPLKKDLFGLPGPASTPQQMSNKLTKNVFQVMKMCKADEKKTLPPGIYAPKHFRAWHESRQLPVPSLGPAGEHPWPKPVQKTNDVIGTTFKADPNFDNRAPNAKLKSVVLEPGGESANPTDIRTRRAFHAVKELNPYSGKTGVFRNAKTFKAEDSMVKIKDANSKDTGAGGQIKKGKLQKDLSIPNKTVSTPSPTRAFSPLVQAPKGATIGNQPEHIVPVKTKISPTLVSRPQYKTPEHARQAAFSQGVGEQTQADTKIGGHILGNTRGDTQVIKPPMAKAGALSGMGQMPKDMQQMASMHASAAAPPKLGVPAPKAAMPSPVHHAQRAATHQAALGGAFQPKGPINSGLELARPMRKQAGPPVGAGAATIAGKSSGLKKPMAKALPMLPGVGKQGMPGKSQQMAPKLSQQTLANKNAKMPAAQKSVKPI